MDTCRCVYAYICCISNYMSIISWKPSSAPIPGQLPSAPSHTNSAAARLLLVICPCYCVSGPPAWCATCRYIAHCLSRDRTIIGIPRLVLYSNTMDRVIVQTHIGGTMECAFRRSVNYIRLTAVNLCCWLVDEGKTQNKPGQLKSSQCSMHIT